MPLVPTEGLSEGLRNGLSSLNLFAERSDFWQFFAPRDLEVSGATRAHNNRFAWIEFPDGSSANLAIGNKPVPSNWVTGSVQFTVFYGGSLGSTNNIRWNIIFNAHPVNADITATEVNASQNFAGPSNANFYVTGTFTTLGSIVGAEKLMGLQILRVGADAGNDTYTGTARLFGVMLDFFPSR